jgi:hypothetical protein
MRYQLVVTDLLGHGQRAFGKVEPETRIARDKRIPCLLGEYTSLRGGERPTFNEGDGAGEALVGLPAVAC